jgi:hypothetical protein
MNDLRDAIERVGARFDPAGRFDDLAGRRHRARVRRRVAAGALALTVAAAGTFIAVRAFSTSATGRPAKINFAATSPTPSTATPSGAALEPSCPTPPGERPAPVVLARTSGPAGSSVEVSGTFETGEQWLQLWWNADGDTLPATLGPPPWPPTGPDLTFGPAGPGPVVELGSVTGPTGAGDCSFQTEVTIPDVSPGSYQVAAVFGGANPPPGEAGYVYLYATLTFEVTG